MKYKIQTEKEIPDVDPASEYEQGVDKNDNSS